MKTLKYSTSLLFAAAVAAAALAFSCGQANANVYASNVKINGGLLSATANQGQPVTITYILNEPATAGVKIEVVQGATVVRTIDIAAGAPGTTKGLNTVTWDGKNGSGGNVAAGSYSIRITASATGYDVWTHTTSDANDGNQIWEGRGIAVNKNKTSPYYGRIILGNSRANSTITLPGDRNGVIKLNADGSYADEGAFTTGGHAWANDFFSPWHIEISDDDYIYINEWTGSGEIFRWDMTMSEASMLPVLRPDNWQDGVNMSGPAITGTGTNTAIYMADVAYPAALGIVKYTVGEDGKVAQDDKGTIIIPVQFPLTLYPYDVAIDKDGNYYVIQTRANIGDMSPRVIRFPANYDVNTNAVYDWSSSDVYPDQQSQADWNYANAIAVDPTGTYVSVAFRGVTNSTVNYTYGNTKVFYASNGVLVTNINLEMNINGSGVIHSDRETTWDAVGNLYYIDNWVGVWRAVSPPGANSSTTAPPTVLTVAAAAQPPSISNVSFSGNTITITFTSSGSEPASAFKLYSSTSLTGEFTDTGATVTGSGGNYQATAAMSGPIRFYRIRQ